jgi:uncharacterized protein
LGKGALRLLSIFLTGIVFGLGITISGMINPAKVINFFDIVGTWDPSLIFVMVPAMLTAMIGYALVFRLGKPLFDQSFHIPVKQAIDRPLIFGSAIFGIGWGISGFCPGGAIPALGIGSIEPVIFVAAMIAGIVVARTVQNMRPRVETA